MKKTHFAITLLELSTLINQSRAIVTKNRFKVFDSSTSETIIKDELYVKAMFAELPIANYFEQQSFFVLRLVNEPKQLESNISSSSLYEVNIVDIEIVLPVTKEGKNIVIQSNNLPGVRLGEPLFEFIWNDFFWNRHADLTLCLALEYADKYVLLANKETVELKSIIKRLIIFNDSKSKEYSQDLFIEFLREALKYKRDIERYKNNYDNELPFFVMSDLLACASLINTEIRDKCRQTFSILKAEDIDIKSLSSLLIHDEFSSIVNELIILFKCEKHHILGVLLFLWIRLAKQNKKCRSLTDIKDIIQSLNTFDQDSTRFALILIGLSEEQEFLIQFIHSSRQSSYGIFSATPQKMIIKDELLSDDFFINIHKGLLDIEKTSLSSAELKSDDISRSTNVEVTQAPPSDYCDSNDMDTAITVTPDIEDQKTYSTSDYSKDHEELFQLNVDKNSILDDISSNTQILSSDINSPNSIDNKSQQHMKPVSNSQVDIKAPDSVVVSGELGISNIDKNELT